MQAQIAGDNASTVTVDDYNFKCLFVTGLVKEATKMDVRDLFPAAERIAFSTNKDKQSVGYCFVFFHTEVAALSALEATQHRQIKGQTIILNFSQHKPAAKAVASDREPPVEGKPAPAPQSSQVRILKRAAVDHDRNSSAPQKDSKFSRCNHNMVANLKVGLPEFMERNKEDSTDSEGENSIEGDDDGENEEVQNRASLNKISKPTMNELSLNQMSSHYRGNEDEYDENNISDSFLQYPNQSLKQKTSNISASSLPSVGNDKPVNAASVAVVRGKQSGCPGNTTVAKRNMNVKTAHHVTVKLPTGATRKRKVKKLLVKH